MTAAELLAELEPLTHTTRVQRMIALGRRQDEESRAVLAELERGGFFERFLALYACFGSRESAHAVRALSDPSRVIRGLAIRLVAQLCDESQLTDVPANAPAQVQRALLMKLAERKHQASLDAFLEQLAGRSDEQQFCALLPLGSQDIVQRYSGRFRQSARPADWLSLARFHPAETVALLQQWANAAAPDDLSLSQQVQRLLPELAPKQPDALLALIRALLERKLLTNVNLNLLAKQRPGEMAALALQTDANLTVNFNALVDRLTSEQIIALYERGRLTRYPIWLQDVLPEQRLTIFQALEQHFRVANALLPVNLVEALPQEVREQEARKLFAKTGQPITSRLPYAPFLPWEEVVPALTPFLHSSEVSVRQAALQALIGVLPRQRERLPEVLEILLTRRSEHDAVRCAMLEALGKLPATIWREEHLPALGQIARQALNDVGLSPRTQQALIALLLKLLAPFPDWATGQLLSLLRERGVADVQIGREKLAPAAANRLAMALQPLLRSWLAQEKESQVLSVVGWFSGQRQALRALLPILEALLRQTRSRQEAGHALELLSRYIHERMYTLVPALLQEDPSWITFPTVSAYLLRRRQELLTPFLRFEPVAGRWGSGKKRVILPITRQMVWATAPQQETLADALSQIVLDETQESRTATQAVKMLAFLPAISAARLKPLAEHPQSVIRTTALFTLGHLDTDDGFPMLVEALQDARARIAIHVVRAKLLAMPTEEALKVLRDIPLDRVTVAKEVMRLIGDLPGEAAYQELLALERSEDLHRDVRAALLRALSKYLERAETWEALERAARSPEAEVALAALPPRALQGNKAVLARELTNRPGETVGAHLLRWLAVLLDHPKQVVWHRAVNFCTSQGLADTEQVLLPRLLALLQVPGTQGKVEVARALFLVRSASDAPLVTQAIEIILPQRGLLSDVIQQLYYAARNAPERLLAVMRIILEVLARDPKTITLQVQCALRYLPPAELPGFLERLAQGGQLHADALAAAVSTINNDLYRLSLEELQGFEAALAASEDERLRRLALAVLQVQSRKQNNWSEAMRERLRAYRADRSLLVASAAEFIFPPDEGEDDEEVEDDHDDYDE